MLAKLITPNNLANNLISPIGKSVMQNTKNTSNVLGKMINTLIYGKPYTSEIARKIEESKDIEQGTTPQATQNAVPQETPDVSVKQETEATMQKELEKYYEREDAIRKETQEREDTAYQRAVADMRKAGIDPNLVGVSQSASGGGITNATQKDLTRYSTEMNVVLQLLMQEIENEFKADQATRDRVINTINNAISVGGKLLGSGMLAGLIK